MMTLKIYVASLFALTGIIARTEYHKEDAYDVWESVSRQAIEAGKHFTVVWEGRAK